MGTGYDNFLMADALDQFFRDNYFGEIRDSSIISSFNSPVERYLYILYLLNINEQTIINS